MLQHIIQTTLGADIDSRDKARAKIGDSHPEAVTFCGVVFPLRDGERLTRLGSGEPPDLCPKCFANLIMIEDR